MRRCSCSIILGISAGAARAEPPPEVAAWRCGEPVPVGYHRVAKERRELLALGALVFVAPYTASAISASASYVDPAGTSPPRADLWIPAIGPFLELGGHHGALADTALVADGLVQLAGIATFAYALATPTFALAADRKLVVAPLVGGATGAAIGGRF